ncbi:Hint domain-containing protein, partial [Tateyamaria sp. syn59]|uniref:Hint domain-containing protein n=1 Tax=Tateyamaria sp. syn59 TaxID=2576942 RepID=UPI00167977C7
MANVTGSDNTGGVNQDPENTFGDGNFWFEWIEFPSLSNNSLAAAGFNIADGSLGPGQTVYNAGTSDTLNLPTQSGTLGNNDDFFGIRISTTLEVAAGGEYTFTLNSDDGSRLYVNGQEVVESDAARPVGTIETGSITLGPGQHEIVIIYYEAGGQVGLFSTIDGPDYAGPTDLEDANISANAGDDTISTGEGFDNVSAGDGDDVITDDGDGGSFSGGAGNDTITVTGSVVTVDIDAGADDDEVTVFNAVGSSNTIDLGEGNDTFTGGDAADSVTGGEGDDVISAGAGNDLLDGGSGDDTFNLFTGDDTITGGLGNDVFNEGAGEGADVITDFNVGNTGSIDDGDQSNNDFVDLSGFYNTTTLTSVNGVGGNFGNALAMMRADAADGRLDGTIDGVNYTAQIGEVDLTLQDGTGGTVTGDDLTFDNTNVVCFTEGTWIKTVGGERRIEDLRVGDRVLTMDNGYQAIRWIGGTQVPYETLSENPKLRPIRIRAGALGSGLPNSDLMVSRQHRVLVRSAIAIRMFDTDEVLIPAIKLLDIDGIDVVDDLQEVAYFHMLFDHHEIVFSNGAPTESLFTGPEALKAVSTDAQKEIAALFPEIMDPHYDPTSARVIPEKGAQMRNLVKRHQKNRKDLL